MIEILTSGVTLLVAVGGVGFGFYKYKQEHKAESMAERALLEMLQDPRWTLRSFTEIRRHFGGFDDAALGKLLHKVGALQFDRRDGTGKLWGLRERNTHLL